MRVLFHKVSNERHALEIVRPDGSREAIECETRSYLLHDLLHYAIESEAGVATGFWGTLWAGKTLAEMNDRTGRSLAGYTAELMVIEQVVGALTQAAKGGAPEMIVERLRTYAQSSGATFPAWLSVEFVSAVQARMRKLMGQWKSTAFGSAMELRWPPP